MNTGQEYADVVAVLRDYFDGFYKSDVATLRDKVFHPNCHLHTAQEGNMVDDDMDAVYARVGNRQSPASKGEPRVEEIVSIDFSSPVTAMAKVRLGIAPRLYTDYLTLLKVDGSWRINAKTYSWVALDAASASMAAE